eukprot:Em0796g1a
MLESYITPLVLSYVDKSWATRLSSEAGRVQELTIHIPWTALGSEPVEVQLNNVELVLKLKDVRVHSWNKPRPSRDETATISLTATGAPVGAIKPCGSSTDSRISRGPSGQNRQQRRRSREDVVITVVEDECDLTLSVSLKAFDLYTADEAGAENTCTRTRTRAPTPCSGCAKSMTSLSAWTRRAVAGRWTCLRSHSYRDARSRSAWETKFVEGLKVKQTTHVHCSELRFSVTEDQFSLFLRLMDWLLAMYYSSKKLKGRDDQCPGSGSGSGMQQEGHQSDICDDPETQAAHLLHRPKPPFQGSIFRLFSGCMARVEKEPSVQRFLVSVGIVGVASSVHRAVACAPRRKRGEAIGWETWMLARVASHGGVPCSCGAISPGEVFALGREEPQNPGILHGSLFGLPYKQSARWEDAFPACTEALRVGSVAMVRGPDVVHRVHHFVSAFSKSLGTRPLLSQGMVVIGDPVAETTFNISVSQILLCVTSNSHFVSLPAAPKLPGNQIPPPPTDALCLRLGTLCSNIIMPMYGGNATEDISQRFHACVELCSAEIKLCTHFNPPSILSPSRPPPPPPPPPQGFTVTGGAKPVTPACLGLSLKVAEVTASLSQLALVFDLASSWRAGPTTAAHAHKVGVELERSASEGFASYSLTVAGVCAWVHEGGEGEEGWGRKKAALVLTGPMDCASWMSGSQLGQTSQQQGNLVEGFLSIPVESQREKMFPVLQLSISGFGVSLEPAFLDYIRALPLHLLTVPPTGRATEVLSGTLNKKSLSEWTVCAVIFKVELPNVPVYDIGYSSGHTLSVIEQAQEHSDWLSVVRIVVVKIKVSQSLIMITQNTQFQEAGLLLHPIHSRSGPAPAAFVPKPTGSTSCGDGAAFYPAESTRGHILDQPVLKGALLDTLPWECRELTGAPHPARWGAQFVLEPTNGEVAMATTGEGEEEGKGLRSKRPCPGSHSFPAPPFLLSPPSLQPLLSTPLPHIRLHPRVLPPPPPQTCSSALPPGPSGRTHPSKALGEFTLCVKPRLHTRPHPHGVSKLSADMEGVTFCVDVQGRATIPTIITQLKVTSAECYYLCSEDNSIWRPLLAGSKVFSSTGSVLPKPCATAVSTSLPSLHVSSRDSGGSSSFVPIFIQAEFKAAASEGGSLV